MSADICDTNSYLIWVLNVWIIQLTLGSQKKKGLQRPCYTYVCSFIFLWHKPLTQGNVEAYSKLREVFVPISL